jgi:hypothetical protein
MLKISLCDGTKGNRYRWGLTRKRILRKRYGITKGKTMVGLHFGLYTLYYTRLRPLKSLWNFSGAGRTWTG